MTPTASDSLSPHPPVRRWRKRWFAAGLLAILAGGAAWRIFSPPLEVRISPETTYITAPLVDGRPDYLAWWNQHLSEGVTAENNAAVLMFQVLPVEVVDVTVRPQFYEQLGIDQPRQEQQVVLLTDFLKSQQEESARRKKVEDAVNMAEGALSAEEYPELAAWVQANAKALAVLEQASRRERFYAPVFDANAPGRFATCSPINLFPFRDVSSLLRIRSLLKLGAGDIEGAIVDCHTLSRLCRLISQSGTLLAVLLGDANTFWMTRNLLLSGVLNESQIAGVRREISARANLRWHEDAFLNSRLGILDVWQGMVQTEGQKPVSLLRPSDPNGALLELNQVFDEYNRNLHIADPHERLAAVEKLKDTIRDTYMPVPRSTSTNWKFVRAFVRRDMLEQVLWELVFGGVENEITMPLRQDAIREVHLAGCGVAAYHARTGRLPTDLKELVPMDLDHAPSDFFTGEPLRYRVEGERFLIWSTGPNLNNDGGLGDDLTFGDSNLRQPAEKLPAGNP